MQSSADLSTSRHFQQGPYLMFPRSCLQIIAIILLTSQALVPARSAELPTRPRARDRQVAVLVTTLLESQHLTRHTLDDQIGSRTLKVFLERLDPRKLYFSQADIASFLKMESLVDDQLANNDLTIAYTVFHRFQERVRERTGLADELLTRELDFSRDEIIHQDPSLDTHPKNAEEATDRWRRQIKYDLLLLDARNPQDPVAHDQVKRHYHQFAQRIANTTADDLLEIFLTSLTRSFDPHSTYLSPPSYESLQIRMRLNYQGIGATLEQHLGFVAIRELIPGGDAAQQGKLRPKDRIVSIGQGTKVELVDVTDKTLREIVNLIRGPEGTVVRLGVLPADGDKLTIHQLTRTKVKLQDAEASGTVLDGPQVPGGKATRVGVVRLPSFYVDTVAARKNTPDYKSCTRDVRRILENFKKQQVDVVLLDLRKNGGGSLLEAVNLTGLFIDQGPIVQVKDSHQRVTLLLDTEAGTAWPGPLVVLTSRLSASASEIVAGAIQDYQRGIVLGDPATHGKGTVQQLINLNRQLFRASSSRINLGALKLTTQKFYRPNGETTQLRGVLPDIVLPSFTGSAATGESQLDYTIPFDKVAAIKFTPYLFTNPTLVKQLTTSSQARRQKSVEMQDLEKRFKRFHENQQAKSIPLDQQKYLQGFANPSAKPPSKPAAADAPGTLQTGPYLEEILAITRDYTSLLQAAKITLESKSAK
ncbi:MAG: carboxy terminal-processing peptidase [Pirellulaceae bacterium]|nr:carboxy terminal-processing peptidase [Pirellulaceae bacterium]